MRPVIVDNGPYPWCPSWLPGGRAPAPSARFPAPSAN